MADAHANFAYSTVAAAPSPASSGTSLTVAAGDGAKFPAAPFNATVWPTAVQPLTSNAEIVRVTDVTSDVLTVQRTQESSSARTVVVGDQIAATITAKTLTDIEAAAGGLPTGWTEDASNPANVSTNGGTLFLDTDGFSELTPDTLALQPGGTGPYVNATVGNGVASGTASSVPAFTADGGNGATVALDAGGLLVSNMADPVDPQDGATEASTAAAVAALSSVYQPLDSDLTAIAALTTTSFGRGLLADANAAALRTSAGLGSLATQSGTFSGSSSGTNTGDQTLSDATITTSDITTNNVSTSKHGFAPKAPNDATKFLDGTGAYSAPVSSGPSLGLVYMVSIRNLAF